MNEEDLWLEAGPEWETVCYERVPTKQWLKPSDALVIKMLESWKRKRYGAHQQIDVNYGGVLRLEKDAPAKPVIEQAAQVFEDEPEENPEQRGGHLALAAPAKSSEDFEKRAASGEFNQAEVRFRDADGKPAALRPDIEELRWQAAEFKSHGPSASPAVAPRRDFQAGRSRQGRHGGGRGAGAADPRRSSASVPCGQATAAA